MLLGMKNSTQLAPSPPFFILGWLLLYGYSHAIFEQEFLMLRETN